MPSSTSPDQPPILFPYSLLSSSSPHSSLPPTKLPTPTQRSLLTNLQTLPSTTTPSQTALHDLSDLLTDSLARTGWTDRVRALALELLRNGTCTTFPELLTEVLGRAKTSTSTAPRRSGVVTNGTAEKDKSSTEAPHTNGSGSGSATGSQGQSQNGSITVREGWFGADGLPDVRIPEVTVDTGVEYLKERIRECVKVVPDEEVEIDSDEE